MKQSLMSNRVRLLLASLVIIFFQSGCAQHSTQYRKVELESWHQHLKRIDYPAAASRYYNSRYYERTVYYRSYYRRCPRY